MSFLYIFSPTTLALLIQLLYGSQTLNKAKSSEVRTQKPGSSVLPHRPHSRPTLNSAVQSLFTQCEVWSVLHLFRYIPCAEITNMITDKNGRKHSLHQNFALRTCLAYD